MKSISKTKQRARNSNRKEASIVTLLRNSKRKKASIVTLVYDVLSCPVLHFYQVSSKLSEGYLTYRAQSIITVKYDKGSRGHVYSSCVWSAMLHASETWPLTKPNLQHLQRNDRAMIRQICNVRPQDMSPPGPMSYLCGLALRIWTSF